MTEDFELEFEWLQKSAHETSKKHGWWDEPVNIPEKLALIHSEVSEALEDFRNQNSMKEIGYELHEPYYLPDDDTGDVTSEFYVRDERGCAVKLNKPCGFPSEMADVAIRVMDLCEYMGIDLGKAIEEKMLYNMSRPYKHGGKVA